MARATGQGGLLALLMGGLAWAQRTRGELASATEVAEASVESCRLVARAPDLSTALAVQAWVASLTGDRETSRKAARECIELLMGLMKNVASAGVASIAAAALVEIAECDGIVDLVVDRVGGPGLSMLAPSSKCQCYEILTRAELALGRLEEAEAWSQRAQAVTERVGLPIATALAHRAAAEVALARVDLSTAVERAMSSAERAESAGARLDAARARMLAGRALAQTGERDGATTELTKALEEFVACGAKRLVDEASAELRRLGRRTRIRPTADPRGAKVFGLTARESQIAHLVSQGKTNREIAAELFVSERTVENHVAHIFAKLGVSSRTALAVTVARGPD